MGVQFTLEQLEGEGPSHSRKSGIMYSSPSVFMVPLDGQFYIWEFNPPLALFALLSFKSLSIVRLFHNSTDCNPPGFSIHDICQARILEPGDLPHPGMEPVSPALAGGFFTAEPP